MPSKGSGVPPQGGDWVPPPEGALRILLLCCQQFYASALQPLPPSHLPSRIPPPQGYPPGLIPPHTPRPASQRWRPKRPLPLIFGGVLEEEGGGLPLGQTPPPGPDDRGYYPVPGTQQAAHGSPPRIDPALSQLRSCHCSRLQAYYHFVGWADDSTCPDCRSTDHTVAHLFSCLTHSTDLAPGVMWTAPLQIAQFLAGLPPFSDLPPLQVDFDSFPP